MTDTFISFDNEIWKPVLGYEDAYEVSDMGRVRSKDRKVRHIKDFTYKKYGKIKTPYLRKDGYYTVSISKNSKVKNPYIHRLLMEAFCGKSDLHIDHKNGNSKDNRLENLEYVTARENVRRGYRTKDVGVRKIKNRWVVYLKIYSNKYTYFGSYKTKEMALEVRDRALLENNIPTVSGIKNTDFI